MKQATRKKGKKFKAGIGVFLSLLMVMVTVFGAFAAESGTETYTIRIYSATQGHTYEAYQIFSGDYYVDNEGEEGLSNISWGSALDESSIEEIFEELSVNPELKYLFADVDSTDSDSAAQVAEVLEGISIFETLVAEFASIIGEYINEGTGVESTYSEEEACYLLEGLEGGYYLIKDQDASQSYESDVREGAYTSFILAVAGDQEITSKEETVPSIEKWILVDEDESGTYTRVSAADAVIGELIRYELVGAVPDMEGYTGYIYVVEDELSEGLTFEEDSVSVTIAGEELDESDFTVSTTENDDGTTLLKIILRAFIGYASDAGEEISITYCARLNELAVVGESGNVNEVSLFYSNNPNFSYATGDYHAYSGGIGQTYATRTLSYTARLLIAKVDENGSALEGAVFSLSGNGINQILSVSERTTVNYVQSENGSFYWDEESGEMVEIADGESVATGTILYERSEISDVVVSANETDSDEEGVSAEVDENGLLLFTGLGAGTYTLEELKSPSGYNKLSDPVTIHVLFSVPWDCESSHPEGSETCVWEYYTEGDGLDESLTVGDADEPITAEDGLITLTIENQAGSLLPSAGGAGTFAFAMAGIACTVGAVLVLFVKKDEESCPEGRQQQR